MLIVSSFSTPTGWLDIKYDEHYLYQASFTENPSKTGLSNALTSTIEEELSHYFSNPHYRFRLSLKPQGSIFQQRVWQSLLVIPVGRTITYGELAQKLQSSPRAIGQACKTNPLALFIPCHRVVGKNNQGGYMGRLDAIRYKIYLLSHEASFAENSVALSA